MDEVERRLRQQQIQLTRSVGGSIVDPAAPIPDPPYAVRNIDMIFLMCRFTPEAVARIVPPELTPAKSCWGPVSMFSVGSGWAIAPYSAMFMALEVEGYDSPDGSLAMYMHSGLYSDVGGQVMRDRYNRNFGEGRTRLWQEGRTMRGETVGPDGRPAVRIAVDTSNQTMQSLSGIHHYIGRQPGGDGFTIYPLSFSGEFFSVELKSIEFLNDAESLLRVINPIEAVWPVAIRNLTMTYGTPRPLDGPAGHAGADSYGVGVVSLFSRMGRPAAIVGADGRVVTMNASAEALLDHGSLRVVNGHLITARADEQRRLDGVLHSAGPLGIETVSERVMVRSTSGGHAILLQAVALDPRVAGPGKLLVLFDDPSSGQAITDSGPALQMLGLTAAEAKVAALVGAGRSPREAADQLQVSVNTVRSALKLAYDKLGVRRQAELARIVTRLEA